MASKKPDLSIPTPRENPFRQTAVSAPARADTTAAADAVAVGSPDPARWSPRASDLTNVRLPKELSQYLNWVARGNLTKTDVIVCAVSRFLQVYEQDPDAFYGALGEMAVARAMGPG